MISQTIIESTSKEALIELIPSLTASDTAQLILWLEEKDDNLRYKTFLLLQKISEQSADVYPYWDTFLHKLKTPNSYQRSLGLMLLAENARWDSENKLDQCIEPFLQAVDDEKPITVRQCIQSLAKIVAVKPELNGTIAEKLLCIDLMQRKETQRKVLLLDILHVLVVIRRVNTDSRIESYIQQALTGGLLDPKSKKEVRELLL